MIHVFSVIMQMSLVSSYVILIVLAARCFLKRLPRVYSYLLWLIVFVRLICPVGMDSPYSKRMLYYCPDNSQKR